MSLDTQARVALEQTFVHLKQSMPLATKTAADIASRIVTGLYSPIYAQFDPIRLGELQRAQTIALHYGQRLIEKSKVCTEATVMQLIMGYPSHHFVIDVDEAKSLFKNKVRDPTPPEAELASALHVFLRRPVTLDNAKRPVIRFVGTEKAHVADTATAAGETADGSGKRSDDSADIAPSASEGSAAPSTARQRSDRGLGGPRLGAVGQWNGGAICWLNQSRKS